MSDTDLDLLVPAAKRATLGGISYTVPADMPLGVYLAMARIQRDSNLEDTDVDQMASVNQMVDVLCDLFVQEADPAAHDSIRREVRSVLERRSMTYMMDLLGHLYTPPEEDEEEAGIADPTATTPTNGLPTTSSPAPATSP
jgi:hypothetical protein